MTGGPISSTSVGWAPEASAVVSTASSLLVRVQGLGRPVKTLLYADDFIIFKKNRQCYVQRALDTLPSSVDETGHVVQFWQKKGYEVYMC